MNSNLLIALKITVINIITSNVFQFPTLISHKKSQLLILLQEVFVLLVKVKCSNYKQKRNYTIKTEIITKFSELLN